MLLSVHHCTRYHYEVEVSRSTQYIRLTPCAVPQQRVVRWRVELPAPCMTMRDAFDNYTHVLTLDRPHADIQLVASGSIEVPDVDDGEPAGRLNPKVFVRSTRLTAPDDALRAFVEPMRATVRARPLIGITDLASAVLDRLPYRKGLTTVETTAAQAYAIGAGVCQDQVHVFLAACRLLGVAARYVSGYAYSADRTEVASRAWAEAWLANRWVGFDVGQTSAGGGRIKLAVGLDYLDACPVRGVRLGGEGEDLVSVAQVDPA